MPKRLFALRGNEARDEFAVVAVRPGPARCVLLLYNDGYFAGQASLRTLVVDALPDDGVLDVREDPNKHSTAALDVRRRWRPDPFGGVDLLIQILRIDEYRLEFSAWWNQTWWDLGRVTMQQRPKEFFAYWYKQFNRAASASPAMARESFWRRALRRLTGQREEPSRQSPFFFDKLAAVGDELWARALSTKFQEFYWHTLRLETIDTIQLISNDPWVPWEMLRLPSRWGADGQDESNGGQFLCERYALARWLTVDDQTAAPSEDLPWNRLTCFITSENLPAKKLEWEALSKLPHVAARCEPLSQKMVRDTLKDARSEGLHFIGHGRQDSEDLDMIQLVMDDGAMLPIELSPQQFDLRKSRPLVMLNCCYGGQASIGLTGVAGWAAAYLGIGAAAFVGPLWQVNSDLAASFAIAFYTALAAGNPVAKAMQIARRRVFSREDPTWLSYSLYALAHAQVRGVQVK